MKVLHARGVAPVTEQVAEQTVRVLNRLGLHARPAADFVRCARQFRSHVDLQVRGQHYSATRVIDVLLAGLSCGTEFVMVACGPDAHEAIAALTACLERLQESEAAEVAEARANRLQRFDLDDL